MSLLGLQLGIMFGTWQVLSLFGEMVCRQYLPISSPDCSSVFKHFILKLEKNKIMMFVSDDFDDGCVC